MNVEELREYCLSLPAAKENAPWSEQQYAMLVTFTVGDKWFCLLDLDKKFIDVKCAPETIEEMLQRYEGAFEAWHMDKRHWLGVRLDSDVPDDVIRQLLSDGYHRIADKLTKKVRTQLGLQK